MNRTGFVGGLIPREDYAHGPTKQVLPRVTSARSPAGPGPRTEYPSQWVAIRSVAEKLGCSVEALRRWVRQAERDGGQRAGLTSDERQRLKQLERENFELRRANEILKKASAYFAQAELDRRAK